MNINLHHIEKVEIQENEIPVSSDSDELFYRLKILAYSENDRVFEINLFGDKPILITFKETSNNKENK